MTDFIEWRQAKGCNGGDCPQVAFTHNGRVMVRSTKTPHMVAVFDAAEFELLRTGDFSATEVD